MTGISELYGFGPSYIVTYPNTSFAEDAEVVVPDEEGAIGSDGQLLGNIRRQLIYPDVVCRSL